MQDARFCFAKHGVIVFSTGDGTVTNLNGGKQTINGGSGAVDTMYHGMQTISSGGSGTVTNMVGGSQVVASGGKATVAALKGGTQMVSAGGTSLNTQLEGGAIALHMGGVVQDLSMKSGTLAIEANDGQTFTVGGTLTGNGGNLKLGKNTLAYGEVERGFGGKINKKWQINAGVRVGF